MKEFRGGVSTISSIAIASSSSTFAPATADPGATAFAVLAGASLSHLLNDTIQALVPALYPMFKTAFALSFTQVGLLTLTLQLTASLLQPLVGLYTDRRPAPYALVAGMTFTLVGVLLLSIAEIGRASCREGVAMSCEAVTL